MADNASGFQSFEDMFRDNAPEEERQLQEAMARAQEASGREEAALRASKTQAERDNQRAAAIHAGNMKDDGTQAVENITQTASYSDYLKAQQDAKNAWAAVTGAGRNNYGLMHQRMAAQMGGPEVAAAAQAAEQQRADKYGTDVANSWSAMRAANSSTDKQRADAAAAQKARDEQTAGYTRQAAAAAGDPMSWQTTWAANGASEQDVQSRAQMWIRTHPNADQNSEAWKMANKLANSQPGSIYVKDQANPFNSHRWTPEET